MIEVRNLTKKYGDHTAVDHLNFQIKEGQVYGFLGPNGAGKSTTMNMMTGYIAATEGTAIIHGHDISEEPEEAKKCMGYLPEIPPLYLDMTVREYLKFASELKKVPKKQRNSMLEEIMEQVGIADHANRLIRNLSKGYKQRTGLAQALIGYPEILILDEPTAGLDPKQIIEIRELIRKLGKKHTVILSSHILSEISAVCDEVMILSHGKLAASGTAKSLAERMEGENFLKLTIKASQSKTREILEKIPEVAAGVLEVAPSEEPGMSEVQIRTKGNEDVRETVFYRMSENNCPILRMEPVHASLEDVFLELTSGNVSEEMGDSVEKEREE